MFWVLRKWILRSPNSLERGLAFLPLCYAFTLMLNTFFAIYKGSPGLGLNNLPFWLVLVITLSIGLITGGIAWICIPYIRKSILNRQGDENQLNHIYLTLSQWVRHKPGEPASASHKLKEEWEEEERASNGVEEGVNGVEEHYYYYQQPQHNGDTNDPQFDAREKKTAWKTSTLGKSEVYNPRTESLFSLLQVLTAVFGGFAHGANDVSNAIAPFVVLVIVYETNNVAQDAPVPWWILLMGGIGIIFGLAMWGYRYPSTPQLPLHPSLNTSHTSPFIIKGNQNNWGRLGTDYSVSGF